MPIPRRPAGIVKSDALFPLEKSFAAMVQKANEGMKMPWSRVLPWTLTALVLFVAGIMRYVSFLHDDISWLITMAEQIFDGREAYVDIIDVNPPASFLIYTPQVAVGRLLALSSEAVVTISVFAGALVSASITVFLLARTEEIEKRHAPYYAALVLLVLLVLCGDVFAQREHFALISILPLLSCYSVRALGRAPSKQIILLAGISGCAVLAIKPHFILALTFPFLYAASQAQKNVRGVLPKLLWPENIIITLSSTVYLVTTLALFPKYLEDIVPIALDLYVPFRLSVGELLARSSSWAIGGSGLLALASIYGRQRRPLPTIYFLAGLGFSGAYWLQAKGWEYHAFPAVALFTLGACMAFMQNLLPSLITRKLRNRPAVLAAICASLLVFVALTLRWTKLPLAYPPFFSALQSAAPENATVISISQDLIGPQVTRLIGGTWVGRVPYPYMAINVAKILRRPGNLPPATVERLAEYAALDEKMLVEQIHDKKPDIVLITTTELKRWAFGRHKIATVLSNYAKAAAVDEVEIWRRRHKN